MKQGKKKYSKGSDYLEIEASRDDDYYEFSSKAATALGIKVPSCRRKILTLFRITGAVVLNQNLVVDGRRKEWSLGNYLLKVKKAPSQVKFGVAYRANVGCIVLNCMCFEYRAFC